jgi:predicted flap endonuclease-1-like 5' DNA nuclease
LVVAAELWYKEAEMVRNGPEQRASLSQKGKDPMQFWFGVAAGLLIGWIGEWLIGRRSVDRRQAGADPFLYNELHQARQELERIKSEFEIQDPSAATVAVDTGSPAPRSEEPDDLTVIKGIGPVFAERLNAAGFYSYADLAQASPEALQAAVATNQKVASEVWITQAKALL